MTVLPHFSLLLSLRSIHHVLRVDDTKLSKRPTATTQGSTQADSSTQWNPRPLRPDLRIGAKLRSVVPILFSQPRLLMSQLSTKLVDFTSASTWSKKQLHLSEQSKSKAGIVYSVYGVLSLAYGFFIVGLHLSARNNNPVATVNCKTHLNPWLTSRFACSVVEINCYRRGILGTSSELDFILNQFEPETVSVVVFSHCPSVEVPPVIREFASLGEVVVHNSTLTDWSAQAAIDALTHPRFTTVLMDLVNLTAIPAGLLVGTMPRTFLDVELSHTNLTSLPSDLGDRWSSVNVLFLEFSPLLTQLPDSLQWMPLLYFSTTGSAIDHLAQDLFASSMLALFSVSNTPIASLAASMGNLDSVFELVFEHTQVREMPSSIIQWAMNNFDAGRFVVQSGFGSPFCTDQVDAASGSAMTEIARYKQLVCAQDLGTAHGRFPSELVASLRPL